MDRLSQQGQALVELIAVLMVILVFFIAVAEWPQVISKDLNQFHFSASHDFSGSFK